MDFQTNETRIHYPSGLRASRVRRGHPSRLRASRGRNGDGRTSHGSAARLRGGELVGGCLAGGAVGGRTCARLRVASNSPIWLGRSGLVAGRLQGVAVVRAQAEVCATRLESYSYP